MTAEQKTKSLGQAIDEIISALSSLPDAVRQVAIKAACDHLGVPAHNPSITTEALAAAGSNAILEVIPARESGQAVDIRMLKQQKNPASNKEMACLVAFYLQRQAPPHERKDTVTAEDLNRYFVQAGFPLPKRMEQLLVDARAAGYFDSVGRGAYRLNPVGHNLVAHSLPRGGDLTQAQGRRITTARKARKSVKRRTIAKRK